MNKHNNQTDKRRLRTVWTTGGLSMGVIATVTALSAYASTMPAQKPLMNVATGAVPNVMLNLDNSGSMAAPFLDSYPNLFNDIAIRSTTVNPMYYNPRIYYAPRVNADGSLWVSPASNANIGPSCDPKNNTATFICTDRTPWATNTAVNFVANYDSRAGVVVSARFMTWQTGGFYSPYDRRVPVHWEYSTTNAPATQFFRYVNCANSVDCQSGNPAKYTVVDVYPDAAQVNNVNVAQVPLPVGSSRPDCGANATTCTLAQEKANIVRWYNFYHSRMKAVVTAIGQSMARSDLTDRMRVGYSQMNKNASAATNIVRGVRYWNDATASKWKTQTYDWMYNLEPAGGTPSHQSIINVGNYYDAAAKEAWKNDPTTASPLDKNTDLACRRAYHIFLSDGAWNSGTAKFPVSPSAQYASVSGPTFTGNPNAVAATLAYAAGGYVKSDGTIDRALYTPYSDGGSSTNGLSDLTAYYFWHKDFSDLDNNVPPIAASNNPTFWQNMTTYNIGWGLEPGNPLTWNQINTYQAAWLAGTTPLPTISWPTGNLNSGTDEARVNDFIRSGYTGGGRSYSVWSAADVSSAFDQIMGNIAGAGNDAGVAVSGGAGAFESLVGLLKYTTEYKTSDNSGDIKAFKLDAYGNYADVDASGGPVPLWSTTVPSVASRTLFALSNYDPANPGDASNANLRKQLNASTALSSLAPDFQALLNADGKQKTDASFIQYILGRDGVTDVHGQVYRVRSSAIGASVNSPPAYIGGRLDMGYATYGNVTGQSEYATYLQKKQNYPATIFAATNEGMVHVLQANEDPVNGGKELAAYMPKGAMEHQIALASTGFRFKFVLDGPVTEDDVYDSGLVTPEGKKEWRHIVTGSGGRAGQFAYALESPLNEPPAGGPASAGNRQPGKNNFLWEVSRSTINYEDMGYITNSAVSGQLDDGSWVTLMPSGHYSDTGKVGLYVMDALTGAQKYFLQIPATYATDNRGLGGVAGVRDINRKLVAAYAGDTKGNLWRFDLRSSGTATTVSTTTTNNPVGSTLPPDGTTTNTVTSGNVTTVTTEVTQTVPAEPPATGTVTTVTTTVAVTSGRTPKVSYDKPLFTSPTGQPIYAAPAWQSHPGDGGVTCPKLSVNQCGAIVVVGTGILLEDNDVTSTVGNSIYGIWDPTPVGGDDVSGFNSAGLSQLVQQTINLVNNEISGSHTYYQVSENDVDWKSGKRGWYLNLGTIPAAGVTTGGERIIGDVANLGSSVVLTSVFVRGSSITLESCSSKGLANTIYAIDALTGKNKSSFDTDGDHRPDAYSVVFVNSGGYTHGNVISLTNGGNGAGVGKVNEDNPSHSLQSGCQDAAGYITGAAGSIGVSALCGSGNWIRTWRTIISPPVF